LLNLLNNLALPLNFTLSACHFNHKLRGRESEKDQQFVQKFCLKKGIELKLGEAQKSENLKSEEKARDVRYRFFQKLIGEKRGTKIALGHNSNDLAETLLFHLVRGSGLIGLSGIPVSRQNFIRPLLSITRTEIEDYLKLSGLSYRIDKTNCNPKYSRNLIRHKILPGLFEINPRVISTMAQEAKNIALDVDLISILSEKNYKRILIKETEKEIVLNQKEWLLLHPSLQRHVLLKAIGKVSSKSDITSIQIEEVITLIFKGIGKKYKSLPHSLRVSLVDGKIVFARN
jgi:tRNA(Ile)-lysidine synthase